MTATVPTVATVAAVRDQVGRWRRAGLRVGFVPTMGNLHHGHLTLVEAARRVADRVVVSIFVNPTQFGPSEDFHSYPSTPEADLEKLEENRVDLLFAPAVAEMYPDGYREGTTVEVPGLSEILCGEFRPGHFTGVATVVNKLFNIVQPDLAIFGAKDYQQLAVIRRMVRELRMPVEIVGAPIVREANGLAMSSRNVYLSAAERETAALIYRCLCATRDAISGGNRDFPALEAAALRRLEEAGFQPDYYSVRRAADLQPPEGDERELVVLAAARLGKARLIDNVEVTLPAAE